MKFLSKMPPDKQNEQAARPPWAARILLISFISEQFGLYFQIKKVYANYSHMHPSGRPLFFFYPYVSPSFKRLSSGFLLQKGFSC